MGEENNGKKPSFIAYQVSEAKDGKSHFNRLGAAFEHGDGEGHNILLNSLPLDGRITLRTPQDRLEELRNDKGKDAPQRSDDREPESER
ncbi:MAG: hypothetical protein P1U65_14960 [Minwuia sp.]|nr:hypothetical protein [Minwuia sp.]